MIKSDYNIPSVGDRICWQCFVEIPLLESHPGAHPCDLNFPSQNPLELFPRSLVRNFLTLHSLVLQLQRIGACHFLLRGPELPEFRANKSEGY